MSAGEHNFTMEHGSNFNRTFTWTDSAGSAVDLTGYKITFQAKERQTDTSYVIDLNSDDDSEITITDAGAGEFTVEIADETVNDYTFFNAVYWIFGESSSGIPQRIQEGEITLSKTS